MEVRSNKAGRFILCSVVDPDAKLFCIVVPEGRDFPGGWATVACKLRALGVLFPAVESPKVERPLRRRTLGKKAGIDKLCSYAEAVKSERKRVRDSL